MSGWAEHADAALWVGLAFLFALPVGLARARSSTAVGAQVDPLLAVCVASFVLIARGLSWEPAEQADIIFGMLGGIGFVGSGAIAMSSDNANGVSAAVSLWVAGAIGAACGFGVPLLAAVLSLVSVIGLRAPSFVRQIGGAHE